MGFRRKVKFVEAASSRYRKRFHKLEPFLPRGIREHGGRNGARLGEDQAKNLANTPATRREKSSRIRVFCER
jgi:hypothetical protein